MSLKILILDDDQQRHIKFGDALAPLIETREIHIHRAYTAEQAIKYLNEEEYEYCFLDHDLGGKTHVQSGEETGWEVAKWIADHPDRRPKEIIIHSLNGVGARAMQHVLGTGVLHVPFLWEKIQCNSLNTTQ